MQPRHYGRIVVIGSSSVKQPIPGLVVSNAFRPALLGNGEHLFRGVNTNDRLSRPREFNVVHARAASDVEHS